MHAPRVYRSNLLSNIASAAAMPRPAACVAPDPRYAALRWPINRVVPPEPAQPCDATRPLVSGETDVCPSIFLPLARLWEEMRASSPTDMSHYVVNIGAYDGVAMNDPIHPLLLRHPNTSGLAIEPFARTYTRLRRNMAPFRNMVPLHASVSPASAAAVLSPAADAAAASGRSIDVLKVDIDGCDCHVLESILATPALRPKLIQIELGHFVPIPIAHRDMCAQDSPGRSGGPELWGCSAQAAYDVVRPHGYSLLQYAWPDAVFVQHSVRKASFPCFADETFESAFWLGYNHARDHYARFVARSNFAGGNGSWALEALPRLASHAAARPRRAIEHIYQRLVETGQLSKRPLRVELGVAGAGVNATISSTGRWEACKTVAFHCRPKRAPGAENEPDAVRIDFHAAHAGKPTRAEGEVGEGPE